MRSNASYVKRRWRMLHAWSTTTKSSRSWGSTVWGAMACSVGVLAVPPLLRVCEFVRESVLSSSTSRTSAKILGGSIILVEGMGLCRVFACAGGWINVQLVLGRARTAQGRELSRTGNIAAVTKYALKWMKDSQWAPIPADKDNCYVLVHKQDIVNIRLGRRWRRLRRARRRCSPVRLGSRRVVPRTPTSVGSPAGLAPPPPARKCPPGSPSHQSSLAPSSAVGAQDRSSSLATTATHPCVSDAAEWCAGNQAQVEHTRSCRQCGEEFHKRENKVCKLSPPRGVMDPWLEVQGTAREVAYLKKHGGQPRCRFEHECRGCLAVRLDCEVAGATSAIATAHNYKHIERARREVP